MRYLYPVVEVPADGKARKKNSKNVDLVEKLFNEYGAKYANRNGGYTRIIKIGQRRGDGAMEVVLEFV
jgi:large subunit ribosomal protein L17